LKLSAQRCLFDSRGVINVSLSSIFWHSALGDYSRRGVTVNVAHTAGRLLFGIKSLALAGARRREQENRVFHRKLPSGGTKRRP